MISTIVCFLHLKVWSVFLETICQQTTLPPSLINSVLVFKGKQKTEKDTSEDTDDKETNHTATQFISSWFDGIQNVTV